MVLFYKVKYHTTIDLSVTWKKTRRREEDAATGRRRGDGEKTWRRGRRRGDEGLDVTRDGREGVLAFSSS